MRIFKSKQKQIFHNNNYSMTSINQFLKLVYLRK